jgi:hypothetical protein
MRLNRLSDLKLRTLKIPLAAALFLQAAGLACGQLGSAVPVNQLPHGDPYTFKNTDGIPITVTPITVACAVFRRALDATTGDLGSTNFDFVLDPKKISLKQPIIDNKFYCHCTNKSYDNESECVKECHVTLGCFTGICGSAEARVCRTASIPGGCVPDSATTTGIDAAQWAPTNPGGPACKNMATQVNSEIIAHEEAHVTTLGDFLRKHQPNTNDEIRVTSCGATLEEVDSMNLSKLQKANYAACSALHDEYGKSSMNPDNNNSLNPFEGATQLDCDVCPE